MLLHVLHLKFLKMLKKICLREGIEADEEALRLIAERSTGDLRSAVNDLQALAQGKKRLRYEDVAWLASRDRKEEIFQVLNLIFNSKTCEEAKRAIDRSAVDMDMLFEWVYENIPYQMRTPEELVKAMDAIALADVYRARIRKTGNWKFLRYVIGGLGLPSNIRGEYVLWRSLGVTAK